MAVISPAAEIAGNALQRRKRNSVGTLGADADGVDVRQVLAAVLAHKVCIFRLYHRGICRNEVGILDGYSYIPRPADCGFGSALEVVPFFPVGLFSVNSLLAGLIHHWLFPPWLTRLRASQAQQDAINKR